MVMLCYKNGSLTREGISCIQVFFLSGYLNVVLLNHFNHAEVRNRVSNGSWDDFNKKLSLTPPLNGGDDRYNDV